ncbi:MAG: hypothetical protein UU98_C0029G0016 [Parcubacteria group bacterium GW2011_GWD2_42_14]|nr:MAG: hypothetical protein UU98_C0029G0016 [Parcubacteria group bacterium GW2011_GWD2_42_14]
MKNYKSFLPIVCLFFVVSGCMYVPPGASPEMQEQAAYHNTAVAVGVTAGVVTGALISSHRHWSPPPRRHYYRPAPQRYYRHR